MHEKFSAERPRTHDPYRRRRLHVLWYSGAVVTVMLAIVVLQVVT